MILTGENKRKELKEAIRAFTREWISNSDFIRVHTSGSTGVPKEIDLPKEMMLQSAEATLQFFNIKSGGALHSCISPEFIGGKMVMLRALIGNCQASYEVPSNTPLLYNDALGLYNEEYNTIFNKLANDPTKSRHDIPINMVSVVPSQMPYLIENLNVFPKVEIYLIGGSSIPQNIRSMIIKSSINAWESYGMTETASHVGLRKVSKDSDSRFIPMPDVNISVNHMGCLVIKRKGFEEIVTNDIGDVYEDGSFIINGRIDNVIVTGGKKFHPELMESKLEGLYAFKFFFRGIPDSKWGLAVQMVIEENEKSKEMSDKNILEIMDRSVEHWQLPKTILRLSQLPLTSNGKFRRNFK